MAKGERKQNVPLNRVVVGKGLEATCSLPYDPLELTWGDEEGGRSVWKAI